MRQRVAAAMTTLRRQSGSVDVRAAGPVTPGGDHRLSVISK
jgi:hypothetical protein